MEQDPIVYPLVSILYCVKCNWVLRASWYQQELLQTFTSKAQTSDDAIIKSVILRPSFIPGTFKVFVKKSETDDWIQVWDRVSNSGFPEAKVLKQEIRNVLSPNTNLGHSDKISNHHVLVSRHSATPESQYSNNSVPEPRAVLRIRSQTPTESDIQQYGSPKLAASHKTFCEECLDKLPPTWEL